MAIQFNPPRWSVLNCDFNHGFREPEMVKQRLVVVVAEAGSGRPGLCTVVPLSATTPNPMRPHHYEMNPLSLPDSYRNMPMWAKCDMLYTVGYHRLDRVRIGKDRAGKRIYFEGTIILKDIQGVKSAILHGLKLGALTQYL